ncbi:hypothetical protein C0033_10940 [Clostridium sp. chh4-2]|nr:hypothetical protein C0033_10940 [Clostridium sp. chh4-2]
MTIKVNVLLFYINWVLQRENGYAIIINNLVRESIKTIDFRLFPMKKRRKRLLPEGLQQEDGVTD